MAANPRIQRLGQELIALHMAEGVTCEDDRRKCDRIPEYRCQLGPFTEGKTHGGGIVNFSRDLCPNHARGFARTFHLRLPTRTLAISCSGKGG
jgi:hypothetical protein